MATEKELLDTLAAKSWCEEVVRSVILIPNAPDSVKEAASMSWKTVYFYERYENVRKERKHTMLVKFAGDKDKEDAAWENSVPVQTLGLTPQG
jgi:hypothetical protein